MTRNIPRCQLCDTLIGEGFQLPNTQLYVCLACWSVIETIIKDALPEAMRQVMDKAENPARNELQPYHYEENETE
jgi:hypothetical protein